MRRVGSAGHRGRVATVLAVVAALSVAGAAPVGGARPGRRGRRRRPRDGHRGRRGAGHRHGPGHGHGQRRRPTARSRRCGSARASRSGPARCCCGSSRPTPGAGSGRRCGPTPQAASAGTPGGAGAVDLSAQPAQADAAAQPRLRPRPPRRAAHPDPARTAAGAGRAAGLAVAVPRGPGRRRPGLASSRPPGSAACPTPSPALSSAQRVQTRAAVDGGPAHGRRARRAGAGRRHRLAVAARRVGRGRRRRQRCSTSCRESLQGQAGELLGGERLGGSLGRRACSPRAARSPRGQPLLTVTDTSTLSLDRPGRRDRRAAGPARRARRRPSWTPCPDATYEAAVDHRRPDADQLEPRRRDLRRAALARPRHRAPTASPAPTPRPGHERGRRPAGAHRARRASPCRPRRSSATAGATRCGWSTHGVARERPVRLGAQGESAGAGPRGAQGRRAVVVRGADQVHDGQQVP